MRASKYTAEVLRPIVAASHSMSDVIRRLGITPNGGNHRHISACVRRAGLDVSHFGSKARLRFDEVGAEAMTRIVRDSLSFAQVLSKLGLPSKGRPQHELKQYLAARHYDTSHLRGQGWSRGDTKQTNPTIARIAMKQSLSDVELFVENGPSLRARATTQRLLAMGWDYCCAMCGLRGEWRGAPLVLHLDHINGINNDNRLMNLRFLCPNCHSQTPTYCRSAREDNLLAKTWTWYTERYASVA
jgi:hypothetical protein